MCNKKVTQKNNLHFKQMKLIFYTFFIIHIFGFLEAFTNSIPEITLKLCYYICNILNFVYIISIRNIRRPVY